MKEHVNFYENSKEANMRLRRTIVMYDEEPYDVLCISDHMKDGILRAYLWPLGEERDDGKNLVIEALNNYPIENGSVGGVIDKVLEVCKDTKVIRKMMNSPKFNKFRPFPLGMCNVRGSRCHYIERQPIRHTPQGLTGAMLYDTPIGAGDNVRYERAQVDMYTRQFRNCILGKYPTPQECLAAMLDTGIKNDSGAFNRQFAFARGPLDLTFLAYKGDIVGTLPFNDMSTVKMGKQYKHLREVTDELDIFQSVQ